MVGLLSLLFLTVSACFWLVAVCKIINQRPSKAKVYYIFVVVFLVRISTQIDAMRSVCRLATNQRRAISQPVVGRLFGQPVDR